MKLHFDFQKSTRLLEEGERLSRIDAKRAEIEAKLVEEVDYDSVFPLEGSVSGQELAFPAWQSGFQEYVIPESKGHAIPEVKADGFF